VREFKCNNNLYTYEEEKKAGGKKTRGDKKKFRKNPITERP
jgi:hypothetical protein